MKDLFRNNIWLIFVGWLLTGCNENTMYHSYQSIPSEGWNKSDTLLFHVPVKDSLDLLHLSAEVRNENHYSYQDLYLLVSHNLEDSTTWQTDTLQFILADKNGIWTGFGWGSLFQSSLSLGAAVPRHPGNYTFKIIHGMQDKVLKGINNIGIKIEK